MYFCGYSKDTKAHKLYHLIATKVIISTDVQFVENKSWDGTIENNVKIVSTIKHVDMREEVVQTPH